MAQYYQKINTIFKRDMNPGKFHNCIMPEEGFTQPEFEYLRGCLFECTEKIDGTNMSVHLIPLPPLPETDYDYFRNEDGTYSVKYVREIHGKTPNANIPVFLQAKMEELFPVEKLMTAFNRGVCYETMEDAAKEYNSGRVIVFGEGYGAKIQKGGGNYISNGVDFILFDVMVGDMYLLRESLEDIAVKLDVPIVPLIGYMTIDEAIEFVKKGFKSVIAENKDYDAEGLVLKTPMGLLGRNGSRIITKIKTCDFRQLEEREKSAV